MTLVSNQITAISNKLFSYKITENTTLTSAKLSEELPVFAANSFPKVDLKADEMIYMPSDETTHLWLNKEMDSLFVLDAGCLALVNGLASVIVDKNSIQNVNIFISHFHSDHI